MTTSDYTTPELIVCTECKIPLAPSEFYSYGKYRLKRCKSCECLRQAIYRNKNKGKTLPRYVPGYIYFILAPNVNLVKIGFTKKSVETRLRQIEGQSPLAVTLIHTMAGSTQTEMNLHKQFNHLCDHGEWFVYSDEIKEAILKIKAI